MTRIHTNGLIERLNRFFGLIGPAVHDTKISPDIGVATVKFQRLFISLDRFGVLAGIVIEVAKLGPGLKPLPALEQDRCFL